MELAGYAERGEQNQHGGYTFYLTRAGLDWLGKKLGIYIYVAHSSRASLTTSTASLIVSSGCLPER